MRKLKSLLAIAGLLALPLTALPAAAADCTITNTGSGSNNTCTDNSTYTCTVDNENRVTILNNGQQVATSGPAANSGNTGGGAATSGSATNTNGTTFKFSLTNDGCTVTSVETPKEDTPVTGAGATSGSPVAAAAKPTVLAKTSGDSLLPLIATIGAILAATLVAARTYATVTARQ